MARKVSTGVSPPCRKRREAGGEIAASSIVLSRDASRWGGASGSRWRMPAVDLTSYRPNNFAHVIGRLWGWFRAAPGRFWRWARDPENNRLVWGYIVWGAMGVVVALPELLSAITDVGFPTISGTVGYLEYWHPEFALLVVGLLVWGAFHAIRVTAPELPRVPATAPPGEKVATPASEGGLVRAPGGRLSVAHEFQRCTRGSTSRSRWRSWRPPSRCPTIATRRQVLAGRGSSIPDMQDLHKQFDKQRHEQKKEKEPPPNSL
jgi:hypothetical protein